MSDAELAKTRPASKRIPAYVIWLGLAAGIVVPLVIFAISLYFQEPEVPTLTRGILNVAQAKWDAANIHSYDVVVETSGGSGKRIELEVRDGKVVKCLENGKSPESAYWELWTIPKQFEMMAEDINKEEKHEFRTKSNVRITLHAHINPQYGFPDHYIRRAHGPSPLYFQQKVTHFKPVSGE